MKSEISKHQPETFSRENVFTSFCNFYLRLSIVQISTLKTNIGSNMKIDKAAEITREDVFSNFQRHENR